MAAPAKTGTPSEVIPTLMPCKIDPCEVSVTNHIWNPQVSETAEADGSKKVTAYFRGRRLIGNERQLPQGYVGFVVNGQARQENEDAPAKQLSPSQDSDEDEDEASKQVSLPKLEPKFVFTKMRILGHDEDPTNEVSQLRAIQEWTKMAASIHKT